MKTIVNIVNQMEMVGFLKTNGTQCRFVSLVSKTPVTKIRKDNPFKGLFKVSKKFGIINANYATSCETRIAEMLGVPQASVEYIPGEVWYKHLQTEDGKNLPVVVNKNKEDGKHYIQYFPRHAESKYVDADGVVIPDEEVKEYLYKESPRPAYKPCVISIDLGNVHQLKASGVIMNTEDIDEAEAVLAMD